MRLLTMRQPTIAAPTSSTAHARWLIVLNLLLIMHLAVYPVQQSPELSQWGHVKVWMGAAAGVALLAVGIRLRTKPSARHTGGQMAFILAGGSTLLGFALLPIEPTTLDYLTYGHIALTLTLSLLILYDGLFDGAATIPHARCWLYAAIGLAVIVSILRIYGLSAYPFVDVQDEAWTTAWAVNWMRTGRLGDPTLGGLGDAYYAYPRFYWLMGIWMNLVGVGLWQGRLLGFLLILPVIVITARTAYLWYGRAASLFTIGFLFCSAVLMSAARVRHDIGLTICVAATLLLHTLAERRRVVWLHFAAGLTIMLGMFSHYHAVAFGAALFVGLYAPAYLMRLRQQKRIVPQREAWFYVMGGIAGGLLVLVVQMLPDDLAGWLWTLQYQSKYSSSENEVLVAFLGNIFNIGFFSIFELLLVAAGVVAALRRRSLHDLALVITLLLSHALLAVVASGAIYYYILPLTPVYGLLVGRLLASGADEASCAAHTRTREGIRYRFLAVFVLVLAPLLGGTVREPLQHVLNREPITDQPPQAAAWIRTHVPPEAEVVADLYYYFWLNDYTFTSHLVPDFLYEHNITRLTTPEAIWQAVDADVIVIDPNYGRSFSRYFQPLIETGLLDRNYHVLAELHGAEHPIIIYGRNNADVVSDFP